MKRLVLALFVVLGVLIFRPAEAAIRPLPLENCWYVDATLGGDWACLQPRVQIRTSAGVVPLPPGSDLGALYLRICRAGTVLKIAAQADAGPLQDHAVEWDGQHWHDRGRATAVSPVAYGPNCSLEIWKPTYGSQGIRFVDRRGRIYTGDETYASGPPISLAEWTQIDDLYFGQSYIANDAVTIVDRRQQLRKILHPAASRFIHGEGDGEKFVTAFWTVFPQQAWAIWFERQDLAALTTEPPPIVTPPTPAPAPAPAPPQPESQERLLREVWAKYGGAPGGGNPLRGQILNEVAWRANGGRGDGPWGLSSKESGSHVEQPRTGRKIAHDILHYDPTGGRAQQDGTIGILFDAFNDSGVTWGKADPHGNASRVWVAPVDPGGTLPAPPPPPPCLPCAPCPTCPPDQSADVAALTTQVRQLQEDIDTARRDRDKARWERDVLQSRLDHTTCSGMRIFGFKTSCKVNIPPAPEPPR